MTDELFRRVDELKTGARTAMQTSDYEAAVEALGQAVELLRSAHEADHSTMSPADIQHELADCYGILGNIHRRMGNPAEALAMFKRGAEYETDACYNRTNAVILTVMVHPENLASIQATVSETRSILQRQVDRVHTTDWWTWSDLGLMHLLGGDYDAGRAAFVHFKTLCTDDQAITSADRLLAVLQEALTPHARDYATAIASARAILTAE